MDLENSTNLNTFEVFKSEQSVQDTYCKIESWSALLVGGQTVSMSMTIDDRVRMFL